ncbi:aryl-alcohol dehydrogenase-like predicted oxidoreductase [Kribbella aluminosa]|uniref:Aryl-alcohol dehydrogenase-like predicted oxidoreductase n=1 Tax=Kribbella aluminosa TaxID=416017 RepID=A0ABS4UYM1_9ACTN|nr:aldo/keto reductase [Kribbella aluminosa]MBP2356736.1 aryl-alcohol dehydrogenase-like predicted oxidoreductase [Kribbella aluminosa]
MATIGLGLAALGRPGYINLGHDEDLPPRRAVEDLRARTHALLEQAWQAGVRYFDAARSYGLAEEFLGTWLTAERRTHLTIGSKWGYTYVADWRHDADTHEVKDHSLATFERQWPETLQALGSPPDFYLVHSLTADSPALEDKRLLDRLRELADSGVRVGLSTSGPRQAETLRKAMTSGTPFSAVQATWNVLETSAGAALAEAHDAGWFVVVKEAVANGRLTARAGETPFNEFAHQHGVTPDALAIGAAVAQPWADIVLSGATTAEQLASNLAYHVDGPLLEFVQQPEEYWTERSALPWI